MKKIKLTVIVLSFQIILFPFSSKSQQTEPVKKNTISVSYGLFKFPFDGTSLSEVFTTNDLLWLEYQRIYSNNYLLSKHSISYYDKVVPFDGGYDSGMFAGFNILQNNSIAYKFHVFDRLYFSAGLNIEFRFGGEALPKFYGGAKKYNLDIGIGPLISLRYDFYKNLCVFTDYNIARYLIKTNPLYHEGSTNLVHSTFKIGFGYSF